MTLHYVSLFSGIEAFSVAASRCQEADFKPVFFSEIGPFPCAVLAHHFPDTPNLGDICKIRIDHDSNTATNGTTTVALPRTGIDILAGGSPCQDVSIAGRRAGMSEGSGTRSALAFEYARLVSELHPRIVLWENVPGVLSSNGGLDFAAFLNSLVQRGYSLAWRVLDAQYVRVDGFPRAIPQRRKRVWLVGCLGANERTAAQILFERAGLSGDSAPNRETGQGFACPPGYCAARDDRVVGGAGRRHAASAEPAGEGVAAGADSGAGAGGDRGGRRRDAGEGAGTCEGLDVAAPLCAADGKGKNGMDICGKVAVVPESDCLTPGHPMTHRVYRADGASYTLDAGEGSGQDQRAVLVESASFDGADVSPTLHKPNGAPGQSDQELFAQKGAYLARVAAEGNLTPGHPQTLNVHDGASSTRAQDVVAVGFNTCASTRYPDGGAKVETAGTLAVEHREGIAIGLLPTNSANARSIGAEEEVSPTLAKGGGESGNKPTVATMLKVRCGKDTYTKPDGSTGTAGKGALVSEESAFTLAASQDQSLVLRHIVRRLTPTECERLQGFPDGWTKIPYRGKDAGQCPDSPRYKALGNSWATNCAEWILRRICAAFRLGMI